MPDTAKVHKAWAMAWREASQSWALMVAEPEAGRSRAMERGQKEASLSRAMARARPEAQKRTLAAGCQAELLL